MARIMKTLFTTFLISETPGYMVYMYSVRYNSFLTNDFGMNEYKNKARMT